MINLIVCIHIYIINVCMIPVGVCEVERDLKLGEEGRRVGVERRSARERCPQSRSHKSKHQDQYLSKDIRKQSENNRKK